MWAVEKYIGHWDGYAGGWRRPPTPNNYYLYSDPAGVFQMLPWGTDQTWGDRHVAFDGEAGLLFDDCIADATCAALYHGALEQIPAEIDGDYKSFITSTATLLKPWQEQEQGNGARHESSLTQIDESVQWAREFIDERPDDLADYLAGLPDAAASQVEVTLLPDSIAADGNSTSTATATVADGFGNPVPGEAVVFSSTDPGQALGTVSDGGDGTYTVEVTSSTTVGAATITASRRIGRPGGLRVRHPEPGLSSPDGPSTGDRSAVRGEDRTARVKIGPPVARIAKMPPRRTRNRRPSFEFASDQPGATFVCEVDDRGPRGCKSPTKLPRLGPGPHAFTVSAVGADGQVGPAATHRFFVKPRRTSR